MSWVAVATAAYTVGPRLWGLLSRVDRRVWYAAAIVIGLAYFAHWNADRGRAQVEARVAREVAEQVERLRSADAEALRRAEERALRAESLAQERKETIDELEQRASEDPDAGDVCLPADLADRLRKL